MIAQNTLRRPANWQDFEHLCYRLWREVWKCPEIQKNGRLGQLQNGVDIYGIPHNEQKYWGIQCKGKSEYNDDQYDHPQFTTEEIDGEIEKAKTFTPKLGKLYFSTTALNDAKIQAHIRQRNLDHISAGLFEVHIFAWETIVDLIDEHKPVYDWYVNNRKYRVDQSAEVTFGGGLAEIEASPKFSQTKTRYYQKILPASQYPQASLAAAFIRAQDAIRVKPVFSFQKAKINRSLIAIDIQVTNTGHASIEDYKVLVLIEGDIERIEMKNKVYPSLSIEDIIPKTTNWSVAPDKKSAEVRPYKNTLVGQDTFVSDEVYLRPTNTASLITVKWKLVAKEYNTQGELIILVQPFVDRKYIEISEEDPYKVRTVDGPIEDYFDVLD
jgi:hypothetical protein